MELRATWLPAPGDGMVVDPDGSEDEGWIAAWVVEPRADGLVDEGSGVEDEEVVAGCFEEA